MSTANDNILFQSDTTKKYDIPLTHLDYTYIGKCTDVKELEKIYKVLKSGVEGCYPDLERFCEEKIESLNPKSRVLRKEAPLGRPGDLPKDEWEQIDVDLQNWEVEMKSTDSSKKQPFDEFDDPELPPIRSGFINGHIQQNGTEDTEKSSKRAMPRSYKEWDKFDIDKELDDVDKKEEEKKEIFKSPKVPDIETNISTAGLTNEEKMIKAGKEKEKGNEAFRSGDYEESIAYYTRSIKLLSMAASYNNRAIAYLKTSQWTQAAEDCNRVLKIEPENIKALLRRGTAYKGMKEFQKSLVDLQKALQLEPDNKRAKDLIEELHKEEKRYEEEKRKRKEKGRRMVIEEVDEESEDEILVDKKPEENVNEQSGKKLKIVEIDEGPPSSGDKDSQIVRENESKKSAENESKIQKANVQNENRMNVEKGEKKDKNEKKNVERTESKVKNDKDIWTEDDLKGVQNESESRNEVSKDINQGSNIKNENRSGNPSGTEKSISSPDKSESKTEVTKEKEKMAEKTENVTKEQTGVVNGHLERPKFLQGPLSTEVASLREAGNNLFRTGQYGEAIQKYTQALQEMKKDKTDQKVNKSLLYSNRAACYLKTGDCPNAIKDCASALELVPHSIKPLLRRANAYEILESYRQAYADFKHVLSIDSTVDMALQGSSRCQKHLIDVDGSKWREKLPRVPSVQSWEIPEIVDSSSSPINASTPSQPIKSSVTSTSQPISSSVPSSSPSQSQGSNSMKEEKSPEEKFNEFKAEGNSFVQKGNYSGAVPCYTKCIELLPDKAVSYSNRSLCYLKLEKPSEAEEDCSKALSIEKDNVKALFRRAQARKMLKKHKESLEDLNQLLKIDPKNTAAKKEMDVVKGLWREELNNLKKTMEKPRKRIVIQETDSEDEEEITPAKSSENQQKSTPKQSEATKQKTTTSSSKQDKSAAKGTKTDKKQSNEKETKKQSSPSTAKDSKSEQKQTKPTGTTKQTTPVAAKESKSETEVKKTELSKADSEKMTEKNKGQKSKSTIKATSFGLPQSVPKLEKASPYEFITAWNSLKQSTDLQPYADLLKQIAPEELPKVISNKLDGGMLSKISKCVAEKFVGQEEHGYKILQNISKVPRFDTIAMFMSKEEKKDVDKVLSGVQSSGLANKEDVTKLKKKYSL